MKLKHVGMIVVSVLAMSSAAVSAAEGDESVTTTVNGGVIHFKGEVVNAACAIDSESMNQTVELGQVRSSRLAKAGDLSSAVVQKNMCRTTAHAHHFRIVWPTHQLSLMLVSNICHSPFRKFMLAEWLAAMFLLNCGKKE